MTKKPAKRKIGRPRLPPGKKRPAPIGFRPTPDLLEKLKSSAENGGRSVSQEIVGQLERAYSRDEADERVREATLEGIYDSFGGKKKFAVMRLKASMIQMVEQFTGKSYFEDPDTNIWANDLMSEADNQYGPARTDRVPNPLEAAVQKRAAKELLDIWRSDRPRASKKKRRTKKG